MDVLVIDNEEFLAENLCSYLQQTTPIGIQYVTTVKGALELIAEKKFNIVVSDLQLPDSIDDNWLLEIGRINPGQKLIIISSHEIPHEVNNSQSLNIVGYFEKPFDMDKLVNLINQTFN